MDLPWGPNLALNQSNMSLVKEFNDKVGFPAVSVSAFIILNFSLTSNFKEALVRC